jgi:hypothetical protein
MSDNQWNERKATTFCMEAALANRLVMAVNCSIHMFSLRGRFLDSHSSAQCCGLTELLFEFTTLLSFRYTLGDQWIHVSLFRQGLRELSSCEIWMIAAPCHYFLLFSSVFGASAAVEPRYISLSGDHITSAYRNKYISYAWST